MSKPTDELTKQELKKIVEELDGKELIKQALKEEMAPNEELMLALAKEGLKK